MMHEMQERKTYRVICFKISYIMEYTTIIKKLFHSKEHGGVYFSLKRR